MRNVGCGQLKDTAIADECRLEAVYKFKLLAATDEDISCHKTSEGNGEIETQRRSCRKKS